MSQIDKKFRIAILSVMHDRFGREVGEYFSNYPSMAHGRSIACKQISNSRAAIKALESDDFDMVVSATNLPFSDMLVATQVSLLRALDKYAARQQQTKGENQSLIMLLSADEYRDYLNVIPRPIVKHSWRCLVNTMGANGVALAIASYISHEQSEIRKLKHKYPHLDIDSKPEAPLTR